MTIKPISKGAHRPYAVITCDDCGESIEKNCSYAKGQPDRPNVGQLMNALTSKGWRVTKRKQICPDCAAKEKSIEGTDMTDSRQNVTTISTKPREATREHRREIMAYLEAVYDIDAGRYSGEETDATVAESVGKGCVPAWVEAIRVEFFGDNGTNEAMERGAEDALREIKAIGQQIEGVMAMIDAANQRHAEDMAAIAKAIDAITIDSSKYHQLHDRFEKLKRLSGPKGRVA